MQVIDGENNETFVISGATACNVFCSDACMVLFMLNSTKTMDCFGCGTKTSYYHMVRSSTHSNQVWCSVQCLPGLDSEMMIQAAESGKFLFDQFGY